MKTTHGGSRRGSGAKNRGLTKYAGIKLTPEEYAACGKIGAKKMRYLIRKEAGLCLHPTTETNDDKVIICSLCGGLNPEKFV